MNSNGSSPEHPRQGCLSFVIGILLVPATFVILSINGGTGLYLSAGLDSVQIVALGFLYFICAKYVRSMSKRNFLIDLAIMSAPFAAWLLLDSEWMVGGFDLLWLPALYIICIVLGGMTKAHKSCTAPDMLAFIIGLFITGILIIFPFANSPYGLIHYVLIEKQNALTLISNYLIKAILWSVAFVFSGFWMQRIYGNRLILKTAVLTAMPTLLLSANAVLYYLASSDSSFIPGPALRGHLFDAKHSFFLVATAAVIMSVLFFVSALVGGWIGGMMPVRRVAKATSKSAESVFANETAAFAFVLSMIGSGCIGFAAVIAITFNEIFFTDPGYGMAGIYWIICSLACFAAGAVAAYTHRKAGMIMGLTAAVVIAYAFRSIEGSCVITFVFSPAASVPLGIAAVLGAWVVSRKLRADGALATAILGIAFAGMAAFYVNRHFGDVQNGAGACLFWCRQGLSVLVIYLISSAIASFIRKDLGGRNLILLLSPLLTLLPLANAMESPLAVPSFVRGYPVFVYLQRGGASDFATLCWLSISAIAFAALASWIGYICGKVLRKARIA